MTDSPASNLVTATSGNPPPAPPVLPGPPTFAGLVASLVVNCPAVDVNGNALPGNLTNIKVFFGPSGSDLTQVSPILFPGSYAPSSTQTVEVTVPAYATAYDFEAEVSD